MFLLDAVFLLARASRATARLYAVSHCNPSGVGCEPSIEAAGDCVPAGRGIGPMGAGAAEDTNAFMSSSDEEVSSPGVTGGFCWGGRHSYGVLSGEVCLRFTGKLGLLRRS